MGSVHKVLKAEAILKDADVPMRLIPAPKPLAKVCDLVIRLNGDDALKMALGVLSDKGLPPRAVYRKDEQDYFELDGESSG